MARIHRTVAKAAAAGALALVPGLAAAAWTEVSFHPDLSPYIAQIRVCKTGVNSMYGLLWRANYQVFRRDARVTSIAIAVKRFPSRTTVSRQDNDQWLYGVVAGTGGNVYASALHDDRFHLNVFYRNGIYSPTAGWATADSIAMLKPSEIANC